MLSTLTYRSQSPTVPSETIIGDLLVKNFFIKDQQPYVSVGLRSGLLTKPLRVAPGLDCQTALDGLKTGKTRLIKTKSFNEETVFYIIFKEKNSLSNNLICRTFSAIQAINSEYWVDKGNRLKPNEAIEYNGEVFNQRQCYLKALDLSITSVSAWRNLGINLLPRERIIINGKHVDKKYCFHKAVQLIKDTYSWCNFGNALDKYDLAEVDGIIINKQQCYLNALALNKNDAPAWFDLGKCLESEEKVKVQGVTYSKIQCFVKSLELDPSYYIAWTSLGNSLFKADQQILVNGKKYDALRCVLTSLKINEKNFNAWNSLGEILTDKQVINVNGKSFTKINSLVKSVQLNNNLCYSWNNLGNSLKTDTVKVNDKTFSARECYIKALEVNPYFTGAWNKLSTTLHENESVVVNGEKLTLKDCMSKIEQIEMQDRIETESPKVLRLYDDSSSSVKIKKD